MTIPKHNILHPESLKYCLLCGTCGSMFPTKSSQRRLRRSKNVFCSVPCRTEWQRRNIKKATKRCKTCKKDLDKECFYKKGGRGEGLRTSCKECHVKNNKKALASWRKDNKEHIKSYDKKKRILNKDAIKIQKEKRIALEKNAPIIDLTVAQWNFIKKMYGFRCAYCGKKPKELTKDHIVPLIKGGSHTMDNIVPACRSCNSRKQTGPPLVPIQTLMKLALS